MNFIIEYQKLLKVKKLLSITNHLLNIENKLENIFIKFQKNKIFFYINNGSSICKLFLKNEKIIEEGSLFLNSKIFFSLIENLDSKFEIEFKKIDENLIQIKSEKFLCNLISEKAENFEIDEFKIDNFLKINFNYNFLKIINNKFKEFCRSLNNNIIKNSILSNINIKKNNDNKIQVCVTDSYRVILGEFEYVDKKEFDINISPITLNNIINIFSNFEDKELEFFFLKDDFVIKTNEIFFKSKLFLGTFPNLQEWFKKEKKVNFCVNKNLFLSSLNRTLLLTNSTTNNTSYSVNENLLKIEYKNSEKGFIKDEIKIKNLNNTNIEFSLNSFFLKQLIKNISSEEIIFNLTDPLSPIIFFGKEGEENFKQFILPLKNN